MICSGIADEAGSAIEAQIRAHKKLGWSYIDLRTVNHVQCTELPDKEFDDICIQLQEADLRVACFASGIANWSSKITDPFDQAIDTLQRSIPRMHRLQTKYIRVMTYPNDGWEETRWRDEVVRRMKHLGHMAHEEGIVIAVENCVGWASQNADTYAAFFEYVSSPAVQALYDTGNPASYGQDVWHWYEKAKPHIGYVHIKDHSGPTENGPGTHTWLTDGIGYVYRTLRDLRDSNYGGFVSIEPHLRTVIHEGKRIDEAAAAFDTYVEYGTRLNNLITSLHESPHP